MKAVEASASTREEAIQKALNELGLEMYEVDKIEIIDEGSKGLFGFGARPVKVRVVAEHLSDEAPAKSRPPRDEEERDSRSSRGRGGSGEQRGREKQESKPERKPERAEKSETAAAEGGKDEEGRQDRGGRNRRGRGRRRGKGGSEQASSGAEQAKGATEERGSKNRDQKRDERGSRRDRDRPDRNRGRDRARDEAPETEEAPDAVAREELEKDAVELGKDEEITIAITEEQGKEAAQLLEEIIQKMGIEAKAEFAHGEDGSARLDVTSEDGAILIGRKGRNLSALQYIINRIISRGDTAENTERLVVDVEGYVDRRRATLQDMARSFGRRAKETGRNVRLKPLSPQERRIIHLTLQDDPELRTFSLGNSLYRSVVVSPAGEGNRDARPERPRRDRDRDRGGAGRGRGRNGDAPSSRAKSDEGAPVRAKKEDSGPPRQKKTENAPKDTEKGGVEKSRKRGYGRYEFDDDIDVGQFGD